MHPHYSNKRQHAIVIGGSLGGLLAARVLSDHFERVTIVEKDAVQRAPESRKGQSQTRHLHGLLPAGINIFLHYFPGLKEEMVEHGATVVDFAESMNWYSYGGFKKRFVIGIDGVGISRPLFEQLVRERVLAVPNISLLDNTVAKQLQTAADSQTVTGVITEKKENGNTALLNADLVVDASGRGSRTPQWLKEMGYGEIKVSEVRVNVSYTTRIYKRDPVDPLGKNWFYCSPRAPHQKRAAAIIAIEGNRWIVSVGGWHGEKAPLEEKGYTDYVKSLPHPEIYNIITKNEPLSEFIPYKFPHSVRRHYEKLSRFPAGLLVLGDAITSFNPIYGQGMTSAALQVVELDRILHEKIPENEMAKTYFKRTAKTINTIWQMATSEDFRFPETTGRRPPGINLLNKFIESVHVASLTDEVVCETFLKVMGLLKPPVSLFHPRILWRVMMAKLKR